MKLARLRREFHEPLPAVILAAGLGHRLRPGNGGVAKPLTPLLGLTLLERAILSCREVGVETCYVVTGCEKEKMIPHLKELEWQAGMTIRMIENPEWERGNGISVLTAAPYLNGPFLLLMCDHVFDPEILRCLLAARNGMGGSLLAVDRRTDAVFDLQDATKVQVDGGRIITIGKKIASYNAIDAGLFLCQPHLFEALRKSRREGDDSLTGGIRQLVATGEIEAMDIGDRFWIDIDTGEDLSQAKVRLLAGLSKPDEDGFIARSVNRPLSRWLSERLARTSLTPNAITLGSFLICLSGAVAFGGGGYLWNLLGGLLIQVASVVDGCDGELARLKFLGSRFGGWLDTVLDRYADVAIVAGICYGQWLATPTPGVWFGGLAAASGFVLASYMKKEYTLRYGHKLPGSVVERLLKRDMRLFVLFAAALLNRPFEALMLTGLLTHLGIGWTLLGVYRGERRPQNR